MELTTPQRQAYIVPFEDLETLAHRISTLDELAPGADAKCVAQEAHDIIESLLGADAGRLYCQEDAALTEVAA